MLSEAVQQLLEEGQRSGLFSTAAAQDLITQITADEALTADEVAAQMIEKKVLTPYQAEQLLAGHGDECLIAGRYRILEKLGEGGMGAVYKAHDSQLDRDVAVKVLPAQSLNDADAIARFERESRALAKLSHPNIIQAYDNGEDKGRHFLVMEYVEGAILSAILREQGAIPPTLAADMIYQAVLGLQHAHDKGLVHRDLKPANLLLSRAQPLAKRPPPAAKRRERPAPELTTSYVAPAALTKGIVKILDLGLARFLQDQLGDSQLTKEGIGVGTPDYMAPEQFRDALHADARTDIYGLGCTLYQLISGTVPFPGSSFSEKADAHAKKEPIPLEERCPEVPAGLAFVVSKMMGKHPADRFRTAAEVADALAPYVAGASHSMILLRQTMRFHAGQLTMRAPNRRKRLLAWAGRILAAACFVGLFILAWPSMFPGRSGDLQHDSKAHTAGPGKPALEPAKPKVITIENGLTVAKDGTGQYTTIGDALAQVKPGQTIRVLDDATYAEELVLSERTKHADVTLEASNGAVIELAPSVSTAIAIRNVPGVRVRGFRFTDRGEREGFAEQFILVSGHTPGVVLEDLNMRANSEGLRGIALQYVTTLAAEGPVTIRRCQIRGGADGVWVGGPSGADVNVVPGSGILISDNRISGTKRRGIQLTGKLSRCQITANEVWNIGMFGIQFEDLETGSDQLLIANNTVFGCSICVDLWDNGPHKEYAADQVELRNNLLFDAGDSDLAFVLAKGGLPVGPGDGETLVKLWKFGENHRDMSGRQRSFALPLATGDHSAKRADLPPLDVSGPDFLRPAKVSPLATGGAGGDLPTYVGAVPPDDAAPWDWQWTWDAIIHNRLTVSKDPKAGGRFRTIGDALAKVRAGMTIRVLDDATYQETLVTRDRARQTGITLESPRRATITFPRSDSLGLTILAPNITLRGIRFHLDKAAGFSIGIGGSSQGILLEDLEFRTNQHISTAITIEGLTMGKDERPLIIRNCSFDGFGNGIQILGKIVKNGQPFPCRGIVVRDNKLTNMSKAILVAGSVRDLLVAGNTFLDCTEGAVYFEDLFADSSQLLITNNTFKNPQHSVQLIEPMATIKDVFIQDNLILSERGPDLVNLTKKPKIHSTWVIRNNWRQMKPPEPSEAEFEQWIQSPQDKIVVDVPLLSRDPNHKDFLRPAADSPLATTGSGKSDPTLPLYIGALPPLGTEPWNWDETWKARFGKK